MRTPLPLAPFESYMLADDRASHPMSFMIHLKLVGHFDRCAFTQAMTDASQRHPLLSARVVTDARRGLCWDWSQPVTPLVDVAEASVPLRFPNGEQIDLRSECGVRIWVRRGANRCEVRLQFHHACTDGVGAFRFVEDLLCAYHNRTSCGEQQVALRPVDAELLQRRARYATSRLVVLMRLPVELWGVLVGFALFFLRRPAKVYSPPHIQSLDPCLVPDMPQHVFSEDELTSLQWAARREGVTLNDLLTRDFCLALARWNERYGTPSAWRPIRVMVPVNLRTKAEAAMPAANFVGMVFVDRRPACYVSSRWLLKTIAWELGLIKRFRLALAFVRGTAIVRRIPGGLRFLTRAGRCYATSVFSNIGRVLDQTPLPDCGGKLRAGGLTLDGVAFTTTIRPHTRVGLSCVTYAACARLVLNYDRHALSVSAAEALLQTIIEQIEAARVAGPCRTGGGLPIGTRSAPANCRA